MIYSVIMAGGSGTRFWPKSTQETPKQFLKIFGRRTMLQSTVDRLDGFIPADRSMVVTNSRYVETVKRQLPGTSEAFIIGEPVAKNTAPCVAAAARLLYNRDPDAVMVVLPADHQVTDEKEFRSVLKSAVDTAVREKSLVTIGIRPNRPETGYGYIRYNSSDSLESGNHEAFGVLNFTEKPKLEKAEEFLESGDYLWNSGMFVWTAASILEAFSLYQKEIHKELDVLAKGEVTQEDINRFYHACPSISIDYGIMEKAKRVHVLPADFGWSDVGSWTAVHELSEKDEKNNSLTAAATALCHSEGNLVHSESDKLIALVGLRDVAVVETEDAILICNLNSSQDVREIVEQLKTDAAKKRYL